MAKLNFNLSDYQNDLCWHQMFDTQVKRRPNAIAIVFENENLTYQELNCRANQLAHYLQKLNVRPDMPVGVYMESSLYLPIAILGIFKSGGACVLLQPEFPAERLSFILEDSQVSILLTHSRFVKNIPQHKRKISINCIDKSWDVINQESIEKPISEITVDNLAHIFYTSGSTGKPKGVMVTHNSYCSKLWDFTVFQYTERDRRLILPNRFYELFWVLSFGAQGIIAQQGKHRDSAYLVKLIAEQKITDVGFVPSMLEMFLEANGLEKCRHLRRVYCAGETLSFVLQEKFFDRLPNTLLQNNYGLTEVVSPCFVTSWNCKRGSSESIVPIGRPSSSGQVYLLDSYNLQPVSIGTVGELYISSPCLARGYLNQPELTAEKFIPSPFSNDPKARLYKTGDLARYLPNGNLELIGRIDNQVKIRGFSIELGEIEASLLQHPNVRRAVIIAREDEPNNKHLVAYIVSNQKPDITPSKLRRFLKEKLPDYMIPSTFISLNTLPLMPNGKIDRRALPLPKQIRQEPEETFVAPRNALESQLTQIWEKILKIHPIGIHDNFFDLGGHSLLAITLIDQIEKHLGKRLLVIRIFQAPTIAQQADILHNNDCMAPCNTLQVIQPQGTQPPLFFIGSTDYARVLASSLDTNQPVYGLNLFGLQPFNGTTPLLSVKGIAQQYIKDIQTVQSEGPYFLVGYCADTKITLEIAQQFYASGQKVGLLAFIDIDWQLQHHFTAINYLWHRFLEFGSNDFIYRVKRKLKFAWYSLELSLNRLKNKYHRHTKQTLSLESQHRLLLTNFSKALDSYIPQPYPGHITLFLSREWQLKYLLTLNQNQFVEDGIEVYEIPGYHDNLFVSPQVEILGKQLKQCLENVTNTL